MVSKATDSSLASTLVLKHFFPPSLYIKLNQVLSGRTSEVVKEQEEPGDAPLLTDVPLTM